MFGTGVRAGSNANETLAVYCQEQSVPLGRPSGLGFPANITHPPLVHHANTVPVTAQDPFGSIHLPFLAFFVFDRFSTFEAKKASFRRLAIAFRTEQEGQGLMAMRTFHLLLLNTEILDKSFDVSPISPKILK